MAPKAQASSSAKDDANKSRRTSVKKPTTKQPLNTSERIKRLFTSLCAQIDGGHFNNAVKTCDKILRLDAADMDALQTKLFLLLQTDQYVPALSFIDEGDTYAFERAYSLYRLQREKEAFEVLTGIKAKAKNDDIRGVLHLEAQLNYRQGSYQRAFDLYNQLLDTADPHSEEHSDILTNLRASQKHLDFITKDFLRALDALPTSLTTTLESLPPPQPASSLVAALATSNLNRTEDPAAQQVAVKKVRKSRVPAGVVPGVTPPPDPERWLKKSERSTFSQGAKRRKGGAGGGGATQGSVSMDTSAAGGGSSQGAKSSSAKGKKKK